MREVDRAFTVRVRAYDATYMISVESLNDHYTSTHSGVRMFEGIDLLPAAKVMLAPVIGAVCSAVERQIPGK